MDANYAPNEEDVYAEQQQQQPDLRPEGISDKQDQIIQYVAKYVVQSCDAAQYQHKLRQRTKHNAHFAFMDPSHAYHHYYEYLLESYQKWMEYAAAQGTDEDQGYAFYQQQMQHDYGGQENYQDPSAYNQQQHQQGYYDGGHAGGYDPTSYGGQYPQSAYPPEPSRDPNNGYGGYNAYPPYAYYNDGAQYNSGSGGGRYGGGYEEEQFELVFENGVEKLVPKRR